MMDTSELLLSKENIQPLRHGRDTTKLCAALQAQTDSDTERALEKQREEYETLLRDNTIADPLAVWYDYVNWLEQCFPSQNKKGNINIVLKKCVAKFKNSDHYKNDERFVKLCLKYATINENTIDLFGSLFSHGIGIKCAIFYIAWAELYVMSESFNKADKIYEKGINQLAEPLSMLKAAKKKFEEYMVNKIKSGEKFEPTSEIYETAPARHAYNKINVLQVGSKQVVPSVRVGNNVAAPGKYSSVKAAHSKGPIAIYQDDDNGIDVQPTAKLNKVTCHKAMTKENVKKAGTWTNSKKNVPFAVPFSSLPFQVHQDNDGDNCVSKPTNLLSSALKPKQGNDEFNVDYSKTPLFWAEPYDPTAKPMYCKEQVYAGGLEFQFEELRAIKYRRKLEETLANNCVATPHTYLKKQSLTTPQFEITHPSAPNVNSQTVSLLQESTKPVAPIYTQRDESGRKTLTKKQDESNSKPRIVNDSGRKSFKIRTSEETRSARRKIALGCDDLEKRGSARKSAQSNFAGVVRRTLVLDSHGTDSIPKPDAPSDSFINQTIHTKEAVNEMQQLWFAKPITPPPLEKVIAPPTFDFYVDESCLGKEAVEPETRSTLNSIDGAKDFRKASLHDPNEHNKENAVPINYTGNTGKSTRPVTGVLTLADNVPFDPIQEDDEQTDDEETSIPEGPGNTTGITETWNFTQAFSFPKIIHASTPNCRRSMFHTPSNEPLKIPEKPTFEPDELPVDLKVEATDAEENKCTQVERVEPSKIQARNTQAEQRTLGDVGGKNLSIIVETSREYKSSSSGSGVSACSKFLPFTPGESRSEAHIKRYHEESRKTPFAYKSQSTYGYEASAELSCTNTKSCVEGLNLKMDSQSNFDQASDIKMTASSNRKSIENDESEAIVGVKNLLQNLSLKDTVTKLTVQNVTDVIAENAIVEDIDPFDVKMIDNFLEKMNFPAANHVDGCFFVHSKLPPLKLHSHVLLNEEPFDIKKVLGEGAYAKIFKVISRKSNEIKVIKYQKPAFPWEFYIAREIQARCTDKNLASYFMALEQGYFYENASLLISSPVEYGDLLTAINLYKVNQGKPMSDFLALYFTVQILDIIGTLHTLKIIHGDVKPDNFLVKEVNGKLTLELIDFGRSIDMTLFASNTTFTEVVTTETFTCVEMLTGRPWTYQIDLFGIAGCVHCLLFGDYMKIKEKNGVWGISKTIPRYLAKSGWKTLFESLLNIPSCSDLPNLSELRSDLNSKLMAYGPHHDLGKLTNFLQNR